MVKETMSYKKALNYSKHFVHKPEAIIAEVSQLLDAVKWFGKDFRREQACVKSYVSKLTKATTARNTHKHHPIAKTYVDYLIKISVAASALAFDLSSGPIPVMDVTYREARPLLKSLKHYYKSHVKAYVKLNANYEYQKQAVNQTQAQNGFHVDSRVQQNQKKSEQKISRVKDESVENIMSLLQDLEDLHIKLADALGKATTMYFMAQCKYRDSAANNGSSYKESYAKSFTAPLILTEFLKRHNIPFDKALLPDSVQTPPMASSSVATHLSDSVRGCTPLISVKTKQQSNQSNTSYPSVITTPRSMLSGADAYKPVVPRNPEPRQAMLSSGAPTVGYTLRASNAPPPSAFARKWNSNPSDNMAEQQNGEADTRGGPSSPRVKNAYNMLTQSVTSDGTASKNLTVTTTSDAYSAEEVVTARFFD